jgi:hypothetical protein
VILVIIIVVAWIVILGPNVMKRRSATVKGSISHFHRALRTLEHAAPEPIVTPAYRLRMVGAGGAGGARQGAGGARQGVARGAEHPDVPAMPVLTAVGADQLPRPALAFLGDPLQGAIRHDGAGATTGVAVPAWAPSPPAIDDEWPDARGGGNDAYARRLACRRRRDTLGILAVVLVSTLMIGFVPGAGAAWVVSVVSGAALVAYVGMLVRLRRMADQREQKLRYLRPGTAPTHPGGAVRLPVYMSGRYAHPSNQAAVAR